VGGARPARCGIGRQRLLGVVHSSECLQAALACLLARLRPKRRDGADRAPSGGADVARSLPALPRVPPEVDALGLFRDAVGREQGTGARDALGWRSGSAGPGSDVPLGGTVGLYLPGYLPVRLVAGRETEYRARDRVYGNPIADRRQ
jgi:hypothetical protein